jgi:hypothetical protein
MPKMPLEAEVRHAPLTSPRSALGTCLARDKLRSASLDRKEDACYPRLVATSELRVARDQPPVECLPLGTSRRWLRVGGVSAHASADPLGGRTGARADAGIAGN